MSEQVLWWLKLIGDVAMYGFWAVVLVAVAWTLYARYTERRARARRVARWE